MRLLRRYQSDIYGDYRKAGLRYGLLSGLIMAAFVSLLFFLGYPLQAPVNYATDITLFACSLFFAYRYRASLPDARVFFKELMLLGLVIGIVAAIVYGLFLFVYGTVVDSSFLSRCIDRLVANEQNGTASPQQIEQTVAVMRSYTLATLSLIAAFRTSVMAILTAFCAALLFRTEKNIVRDKNPK
ncbi:MAG: DUF4199 domain-containing protein [Bacteroidales bacterium]|nr:DUF4199 domain-containing protein [Bacteroidales bacterium]